jgi:hypothetical protein
MRDVFLRMQFAADAWRKQDMLEILRVNGLSATALMPSIVLVADRGHLFMRSLKSIWRARCCSGRRGNSQFAFLSFFLPCPIEILIVYCFRVRRWADFKKSFEKVTLCLCESLVSSNRARSLCRRTT